MSNSPKIHQPLSPVSSAAEEFGILADVIKEKASPDQTLDILEAGCGNAWDLDLSDISYHLTGVDLDAEALQIRQNEHKDLDEVILGNLHTVELEENSYDVIYNSFVLEHVRDAERILDNFHRWLRPGGILILKLPDRESVYGFITRVTPHWVHVAYKRYVEGNRDAGKPGFAPYPTVYEETVSRSGIHAWAASRGLVVQAEYGARYYLDNIGLAALPIKALIRAVNIISQGRLAATHTNLTYVIQKPETVSPHESRATTRDW